MNKWSLKTVIIHVWQESKAENAGTNLWQQSEGDTHTHSHILFHDVSRYYSECREDREQEPRLTSHTDTHHCQEICKLTASVNV